MGERTLISCQSGAPGSALTESERERAWSEFVVGKQQPDVAPVVRDSWLRSRDVFHVDPALKQSPVVLPEDESRRRREPLETLGVGGAVLERFGDGLRETQDMTLIGFVRDTRFNIYSGAERVA